VLEHSISQVCLHHPTPMQRTGSAALACMDFVSILLLNIRKDPICNCLPAVLHSKSAAFGTQLAGAQHNGRKWSMGRWLDNR
jgi:hypothetical protein